MEFKEALKFRHACKIFDENKQISNEDFEQILEAGRLAPSSFGIEQWDLEIIDDKERRKALRPICWNQVQITSASKVVVIYAKIADLKENSPYLEKIAARRADKDKAARQAFLKRFNEFFNANVGSSDKEIYAWSRAQCYLMAQNMMMQAACLGIDSCPIEGFEIPKLEEFLQVDTEDKKPCLILTFGYRVKDAQPKLRRELKDIVKFS